VPTHGRTTALVISGGNVDVGTFVEALRAAGGRSAR
jgi:hypothetical protein